MDKKTLEGLDLNLLLALHWLLSEQNVTQAASQLGLSQPATSRALGRLRNIFDDPLLIKAGRKMLPTPKADALQPAVALAVERMRDVLRIAGSFSPSTATGRIRIACSDFHGVIIAMAWIKTIQPAAPGLDLDLVDLSYAAARDMISGKIDLILIPDLAMTRVPPHLDMDQFVRREIYKEPFRCALRKGHPLANQKLTLEDYLSLDHILINPEEKDTGVIDEKLATMGKGRHIRYRTASFLGALPLVLKTDCIITAPGRLFDVYAEDLILLDPPFEVDSMWMYGGWHPNWTHDARHKWVRDRLFSALKSAQN